MTPETTAIATRFGTFVEKINKIALDEMLKNVPEDARQDAQGSVEFMASIVPMTQATINAYLVMRIDGVSHDEAIAAAEELLQMTLNAAAVVFKAGLAEFDEKEKQTREEMIKKLTATLDMEMAIHSENSPRAKKLQRALADLQAGKPINDVMKSLL